MSAHLYLAGTCRILPGHEHAVHALRAALEIDGTDDNVAVLNDVLSLEIDGEVNAAWIVTARHIVDRFVCEHGAGGAVFRLSRCGRLYSVFGATAEARSVAERAYLLAQVRYWSGRLAAARLLQRPDIPTAAPMCAKHKTLAGAMKWTAVQVAA